MTRPKKKGEKKEELVSVQMEPSLKKQIENAAAAAPGGPVSVGHWVRGACKEKLAAGKSEKAA